MGSTDVYGQRYCLDQHQVEKKDRPFPAGTVTLRDPAPSQAERSSGFGETLIGSAFCVRFIHPIRSTAGRVNVFAVLGLGLSAGLLIDVILPAVAFAFLLLMCVSALIGPECTLRAFSGEILPLFFRVK